MIMLHVEIVHHFFCKLNDCFVLYIIMPHVSLCYIATQLQHLSDSCCACKPSPWQKLVAVVTGCSVVCASGLCCAELFVFVTDWKI